MQMIENDNKMNNFSNNKNKICNSPSPIKGKNSSCLPIGGVGIFLVDSQQNKILVGKRTDNGLFAFPGGWLEYGEEWEECGARELREETGINIPSNRIHHIKTFNCYNPYTKYHNVAIYLYCEINPEEVKLLQNVEPDKCEKWEWVDFNFLKENFDKLFFPIQVFLKSSKCCDNIESLRKMIKH